jgi:hypothetical protein
MAKQTERMGRSYDVFQPRCRLDCIRIFFWNSRKRSFKEKKQRDQDNSRSRAVDGQISSAEIRSNRTPIPPTGRRRGRQFSLSEQERAERPGNTVADLSLPTVFMSRSRARTENTERLDVRRMAGQSRVNTHGEFSPGSVAFPPGSVALLELGLSLELSPNPST